MSKAINTLPELLAHACELETEAVERYQEMAEQMEVHNNPELAALFRKMASIEQKHVNTVETLAEGVTLPRLAPWDFDWQDPEAPESVPVGEGDYLMPPRRALALMLACEERAFAFFANTAQQTTDQAVRELAARLAAEEQHHAELLKAWLQRYPESEAIRGQDLDEPLDQG